MSGPNGDVAVLNLDDAGEPILFRIFVPRIQDIEFLVGGRLEVLHSADNFNHAGSTGAIEATGFHFHTRLFARFEQEFARRHFGGLIGGQNSNFRHEEKIFQITELAIAETKKARAKASVHDFRGGEVVSKSGLCRCFDKFFRAD